MGGKQGGTDSKKKSQRKRRKEGLKKVGARGREDAKENCDILLVSTLGPFFISLIYLLQLKGSESKFSRVCLDRSINGSLLLMTSMSSDGELLWGEDSGGFILEAQACDTMNCGGLPGAVEP